MVGCRALFWNDFSMGARGLLKFCAVLQPRFSVIRPQFMRGPPYFRFSLPTFFSPGSVPGPGFRGPVPYLCEVARTSAFLCLFSFPQVPCPAPVFGVRYPVYERSPVLPLFFACFLQVPRPAPVLWVRYPVYVRSPVLPLFFACFLFPRFRARPRFSGSGTLFM